MKCYVIGRGHSAFQVDVSSSSEVAALVPKVKDKYNGRVPNIVVCCAGFAVFGDLVDFQEEIYDSLMATNLKVSSLEDEHNINYL